MNDDDYTILAYLAYSKYLMLDSAKFVGNYEFLFNLLELDMNADNTPEYNRLLAVLHSVCLRAFFDCLFVHDLPALINPDRLMTLEQAERDEDEPIYFDKLLEKLENSLFSPDTHLVALSLDGFAKLVLHQRMEDPVQHLCFLILLWHDKRLQSKMPAATQYLTTFMSVYSASRIEDIERLQEACLRVFQ